VTIAERLAAVPPLVKTPKLPPPQPPPPLGVTTAIPGTADWVDIGSAPDYRTGEWQTKAPKKKNGPEGCHWWAWNDADSYNASNREGTVKPGKKGTVTLRSGDVFNTEGCGKWVKV